MKKYNFIMIPVFWFLILFSISVSAQTGRTYNIKNYGAIGDGKTLESPAINKAIEAASANGGGTVLIPAGNYLSLSIHLKSNICLNFEQGATLIAAAPSKSLGWYDEPEPNVWGDSLAYQDFGHSHWHNSLIWGENLENVSITGFGLINGTNILRGGGDRRTKMTTADSARYKKMMATDSTRARMATLSMVGQANKTIALKNCRNVTIRDISILMGGHFAYLLTGVDNLTLDNLKTDTNRDGIDIDCCNNVRVTNCSINAPWDDGLCLKASYALGYARPCQNITITNCYLSGFDRGTMLNGTYLKKTDQLNTPDKGGVFGRIKLGTESNGDFKNITISNCVMENSRGIALESVDGSNLEDITITNITMRDVNSSPIFMRLGSRMRGPKEAQIGHIRRINISNIVAYNADSSYCSLISGIPGHEIEDIKLSNISIWYHGGGTKAQADLVVPENEAKYPDPQMFGVISAYGFFVRHAKNVEMNNVEVHLLSDDVRPAIVLDDVKGVNFTNLKAQHAPNIPVFLMKNVENFSTRACLDIPDNNIKRAELKKL
jgi:polygalacturonase